MIRVMIVDDEAVSHEYLRGLIPWEAHGFELTAPVYSAAAAKRLLASEKIDIVIFDISMPEENGVSLSSYIARRHPAALMLAVSSHDDYDYVRRVLKNGAHDYILKHRLNGESLLSTLRAMCEGLENPENDAGADQARRHALFRWLFSNGEYPFPDAKGACAATVMRIPELRDMREDMRTDVVEGILALMEKEARGIADLSAVYSAPDLFVSFFLFADTVSQNKMISDMFLCGRNIREGIRVIYKMDCVAGGYPLLCDYRRMPAHIVNAIGTVGRDARETPKPVALSIHNKRRFLSAIEERSRAEAESLIDQVFGDIGGNISAALPVLNEFLDMLICAARERGGDAPFEKNGELERARDKEGAVIPTRLKELCAQVFATLGALPVHSDYVRAALAIIESEYANEITQDETAARLGLSSAYLSKLFKQETGVSFTETLNRRRIDAAKLRLKSGCTIKETALQCGFKRYNYFMTVFKNYAGMTPAEYVKRGT